MGRHLLFAMCCVVATADCAVYDKELSSNSTSAGSSGNGGGVPDASGPGGGGDGGGNSGGSTGSGGAGSTGGAGTGGNGGSSDGSAGRGGASGGGIGGASGGGNGGAGKGGSSGAGTGGDAGADGGGSGGVSAGGASGSGGAGSTGGAAGSGGAAGVGGSSGGSGGAGNAGSGGTSTTGGAGGSAGTSSTGGASGSSGSGGGTIDAGPDVPVVGAVFAVGSFVKATATGPQTVTHTLGQTPKALILWTAGKTNETLSAGDLQGFGASDGTETYAVGTSSRDNVSTSTTSRRMAEKAITLIQGGEVLVAEADLASQTASNFVLNWTTNDTQPIVVHYLAIGGPQVTAKVAMWTSPTSAGNKAVTGIGFRPETVLHFYAGAAFTATPPSSTYNGIFGVGAMDKNGGQWAVQAADWDDNNPSLASRGQQTDAAIYMYADGASAAVTKEASFVSMDTDGFTVDFKTANSNAGLICSLALAGVKATAGTFNKATGTAPASQSVGTAGFRPGAVFFSSYQLAAQTASVSETGCSYGLGASDGTHQGSSAFASSNNASPTTVDAIDKTSKAFIKMNNPPVDAEADLTSLDASGFTLNWTTNDGIASQIGYWALGAP